MTVGWSGVHVGADKLPFRCLGKPALRNERHDMSCLYEDGKVRSNFRERYELLLADSWAAEAKACLRVMRNHKITRMIGKDTAKPIHMGTSNGAD